MAFKQKMFFFHSSLKENFSGNCDNVLDVYYIIVVCLFDVKCIKAIFKAMQSWDCFMALLGKLTQLFYLLKKIKHSAPKKKERKIIACDYRKEYMFQYPGDSCSTITLHLPDKDCTLAELEWRR